MQPNNNPKQAPLSLQAQKEKGRIIFQFRSTQGLKGKLAKQEGISIK